MSAIAVAAATVGASVISSTMASNAAENAAETQAQAARDSAAVQKQIYEEQKALQQPYYAAGLTGQNRLMEYLGLSPQVETEAQIRARLIPQFQTPYQRSGNIWADTANAVGAYNIDQTGLDAAVQAELAKQAATGTSADFGKYATAEFTPTQFAANQDPGYSFRLSEGLKALDKSAVARGGLLSGNTLKGITNYGQEAASQEYQNAFNRYQTARNNTLTPYQQLQGIGQAAASNQAAAAGQYGSNVTNALTGAANAQSAAQIAGANIATQGIGNALGAYARMNTASSYGNPFYSGGYTNPNNYGAEVDGYMPYLGA